MKLKSIALGMFLFVASSSAMAVDGYKGVKFGSSLNELNAGKLCTWNKYQKNKTDGMDYYSCENFKFSGKNTLAMAFFIDKKFERIAISVDSNQMALIEGLKKKYGEPSSTFTADEFEKAQKFGGSISVKFDSDTVIVNVTRDAQTMQDTTYLIYTSNDYDGMYKKLNEKNMESDI